jgi:hypothetical protein
MVGWYDEGPPPAVPPTGDTYVRINKNTGVATEFNDTGIDTSANGVSFGEFNLLWNIDTARNMGLDPVTGKPIITQTAYLLNPFDGKPLLSVPLNPPTMAAIGDFHPVNHHYYGLKFQGFDPLGTTFIEVVDLDFDPLTDSFKGTVTPLGQTVNFLHTLTFIPLDFLP